MKNARLTSLRTAMISTLVSACLLSAPAFAAKVGEPAPDFTGTDTNGKTVKLADFKGKYLVLEWHNKDCPYVKAQYKTHRMQDLQKQWTGKGVAWLEIVSSSKGSQGYVTASEGNADLKSTGSHPTAMVLDADGTIGHAYGAQTTPHMFIVDKTGTLIYNGAIDDHPTNDPKEVSKNGDFVTLALTEAMAGQSLTQATSKPYGCSVKY